MDEKVIRPPYRNFEVGDYPNPDEFDSCEAKIDGWMTRLNLGEGGSSKLWSRSSRLIKEGYTDNHFDKTVLYAEYIFGTEWAKDRGDEYGKLAVFGAEFVDGEDLTDTSNKEVRERLDAFLQDFQDEDILSKCFLLPQFTIQQAPDVWETLVVGYKFEGLVFKNSFEPWGSTMGRMKQTATMDYVCMGFNESDSDTYAGWGVACVLGGLYVDGELKRICKVSGINDELRKEFFDHPEKYIGRVFEAEGKKISKKGALRHPNFLRWREPGDKSPEECTWEK